MVNAQLLTGAPLFPLRWPSRPGLRYDPIGERVEVGGPRPLLQFPVNSSARGVVHETCG